MPIGTSTSWASRTAVVGSMRDDYGDYALRHWEGARRVAESALNDPRDMDELVYTIAYEYRHALELALKYINVLSEQAINARVEAELLSPSDRLSPKQVQDAIWGHALISLVERLDKRLELIEGCGLLSDESRATIARVDSFDGDGERFRFPYLSGSRGPSFDPSQGPMHIDVLELRDSHDAVLKELLYGYDGWLSNDIELVGEYASEMASYVDQAGP